MAQGVVGGMGLSQMVQPGLRPTWLRLSCLAWAVLGRATGGEKVRIGFWWFFACSPAVLGGGQQLEDN